MMEVEQKEYKVQEIADGFMEDDNSSEIIAMHGKLDIRPKYQREYVYTDNKRDKVIDTVLRGLPLGVMYFVERDDGTLEVLDGQQRLISICRYAKNQFSTKPPNNIISQIKSSVTFNVLPSEAKDKFNNYKLNVYVCKGSEKDKIDWFETINIAGEPLEQQEILNAVLYSKWLEDAKTYFSKRNCPAYRMYNKYMSGNYIRQDYLATVFSWHADADRDITEKDKKCKIEHYMQKHRKDENAAEVWSYFRSVFAWVNRTFKNFNEKTMKGVEWGCLFNRHKDDILDLDSIALEVEKLLEDPDVTNKHGIYEYVLNKDEKVLNIRNFSISDKVTKFNEQNGICPICGKKFEIKDMEADHIIPWHEGGRTILDNCHWRGIKMSHVAKLNWAKKLKRDSLYTERAPIEREITFYENHFKGKTILCNCDDDEHSEFFKYFYKRFDVLGLKKLVGVHYQQQKDKPSYKLELYKDTNNDGVVDYKDKIIKTPIYGTEEYNAGDFRSPECIELLKEADIVVTNPPFSLLREFIAQLMEYNKKFLIIGNTNAMGYKEIFPLFKDNKIWLGVTTRPDFPHKDLRSIGMWFRAPDYYELENSTSCKIENGKKYIFITNARWFTNLKTKYKQKPLDMLEVYYTPEKYPKYDNYDAINVDKVADIPCDYPGVMGVPLTFMDKYCPEQFRILGLASGRKEFSREAWPTVRYVNPIQHNIDGSLKNGSKANTFATVFTKDTNSIYYTADNINYMLKGMYSRILIKNKHPQKSKEREKVNKIFNTPRGFLSVITTALYRKVA